MFSRFDHHCSARFPRQNLTRGVIDRSVKRVNWKLPGGVFATYDFSISCDVVAKLESEYLRGPFRQDSKACAAHEILTGLELFRHFQKNHREPAKVWSVQQEVETLEFMKDGCL